MTEVAIPDAQLLAAVQQASANVAMSERKIANDAVPNHIAAFTDLAATLERAGHSAEVQKIRAAVQSMITSEGDILQHAGAVEAVGQEYEPSEEAHPSDFHALIATALAEEPAAPSASSEGDPRLATFDAAVREAGGGAGSSELNDDEDLRIDDASGSIAPNNTCPISGKPLMEVDEPVEDRRGFVYEKADILRFIGRQGTIQCPVSGTNHSVSADQLQPARAVIKMQKLAQRQGAAHGNKRGIDVLDVE